MAEVRKYFVKGSWIFNLESMDDKLHCIKYDLDDLIDECETLQWAAKSRKVTGKEYGRIKEIVSWRVEQRYFRCIANGMKEKDAGACFSDL